MKMPFDTHMLMNQKICAMAENALPKVMAGKNMSGTYLTFVKNAYAKMRIDPSCAYAGDTMPKAVTGFFNRNFESALDRIIEKKGVVGLAYLSPDAVKHLDATGTFEILNGDPIYIRNDRYWHILP